MKRTKELVGAVFTAIIVISIFMATTSAVSATQADDTDTTATLEKIQKAIEEKGAKWTASATSIFLLPSEEKEKLCGGLLEPTGMVEEEVETVTVSA